MSNAMKRTIWLCLTFGCLVLIWGNSCLTAAESGEISGCMMEWQSQNLPGLIEKEYVLRKLAHFAEFALLGFFLTGTAESFGISRSVAPLFGVLLCACVDETIQVFVPGRGPSLIDVWIDFVGGCAGIALLGCLKQIKRRKL